MTTATMIRTETGSQLVQALEAVWAAIADRHPDVPDVVMITGSGNMGLGLKWGHYGPDRWANGRFVVDSAGTTWRDRKPELFVGGEAIGRGAEMILETMLHEAVHAVAVVRNVKDTSRQGRYHNGRFRELAEELGLVWTFDRPHELLGFSEMLTSEATREAYADVIDKLNSAIALTIEMPGWANLAGGSPGGGGVHGGGRKPKDPDAPKTGLRKAVCGCGRIIRVAPSTLEAAPITCGSCDEDFVLDA